MTKVPKLIKAVVDFSRKMPEQLFASAQTVWTGLNGNVNFTNLPVDLNVFKAKLDAYSVSIGEARDGGRKAITQRNTLGEELIRMLRALALHVELNCKDDMNTFLTSGFEARSATRTPAAPLAPPVVEGLDQGVHRATAGADQICRQGGETLPRPLRTGRSGRRHANHLGDRDRPEREDGRSTQQPDAGHHVRSPGMCIRRRRLHSILRLHDPDGHLMRGSRQFRGRAELAAYSSRRPSRSRRHTFVA